MTQYFKGAAVTVGLLVLTACTTNEINKNTVAKILQENPSILASAIEKNPTVIIEALQSAAKKAQDELGKKRELDEKKAFDDSFSNPLVASIRSDELIRGSKDAPITLVEYSDFECPFCSRSYETVQSLLIKYNGKIKLVYKHLPLSFHEQAMISAKYYEAIRLQDGNKAIKFHDEIFQNQRELKNGEPFLEKIAKNIGIDMKRLKKDLASDAIKNRIAEDMNEAQKFGMQGTPGFLLNGIPIRGAYPLEHFESVISELQKRGKLTL